MHRVVVTGMGVICPIGRTLAEFAAALRAGRSGVGPITLFDPALLRTRIAGEVKQTFPKYRDRKIGFAVDAARLAVADATDCGMAPNGPEASVSLGMGLELFTLDDL